MTRKKYIKQLMSYGMDRNSAAKVADEAWKYGSYKEAYKHILPRIKFIYSLKQLRRAASRFAEVARSAAANFLNFKEVNNRDNMS